MRWINWASVSKSPRERWIIDFGVSMTEEDAALYEAPFEYVRKQVRPHRQKNRRPVYARRWWIHAEPRPKMRAAYEGLDRFLGTGRVGKHRVFFWIPKGTLPDCEIIVFARSDDLFFGVLQSRFHTVWSLAKGTQLREKESGFRYTPTTTFETFPLPRPIGKQSDAIATAAKAMETFRQGWLRPKTGPVRSLTQLYTESPTWLKQAHDRLDAAVAQAYGWPVDLPDEEILARLLALNGERKSATSAPDDADVDDDSEG